MNFSTVTTDPRLTAIQLHGGQLQNAYILARTRHIYSRLNETNLIAVLSGVPLTSAQLADTDQIAQAYLYLADVRAEVQRCSNDPTLTRADFVDPDPNANRPYTRAAIWSGLPQAKRTNLPIVSTDYNLSENDSGVLLNNPGSVCYLPPYTSNQLGNDYKVKNGSTGDVTIQAATGEFILVTNQLVPNITFPLTLSRQLTRESSSQHWFIS